jgi:hypothetical protein
MFVSSTQNVARITILPFHGMHDDLSLFLPSLLHFFIQGCENVFHEEMDGG